MSLPQQSIVQEAPAGSPPVPLRRNRDFLLLCSGQIVSSIGTQVSTLAFPLLILALTHSAAQAGLLGALRSLPYILLSLPAGALVDRWDRKRTMILSDTGRALALASVPCAMALGHLTFTQLALVALIEGTLFTFFNIAESACLPQVVPQEQLPDAVGMNWTVDSLSALIGPSISGALYAAGRALPFALDAVSYAASVVSLLFIKSEFQRERTGSPESLWTEIAEGLLWLWRHPLLRFLALLVGGLNLFCFGYPIIMIVRAQQLHAGAFAIGLLFASGGVGSILGAMAVGPVQRRFTLGQIMIGGAWIWVITWLPYALAPNLILFGVANAVGWVIIPLFIGTQLSYRLKVIPDELQGRAGSVFKLIAFGCEPISLAMTGVLVQLFGPVTTIVILVVPQLALAIVASLHRDLRRMPRLADVVASA